MHARRLLSDSLLLLLPSLCSEVLFCSILKGMKYNKLVRDKIPEIIKDNGEAPVTHIADGAEYWERLKAKLEEETKEAIEDTDGIDELADVLEVIHAMLVAQGMTFADLEKARLEKKAKRGGFGKKIILEKVE